MRFAIDIVNQTREAVGKDFILIFRLSMLDLVENGSSWEEIKTMAMALEDAGVTIINTGIGWHEARIPTIATICKKKNQPASNKHQDKSKLQNHYNTY